MKHLLVGGAGFLGRHLASELLARGDTVAIYDNYCFSDPLTDIPPNLEMMIAEAANDTAFSTAMMSFRPDNVVWLSYFFSYDPGNIPHIRHSWLMHGLVKAMQVMVDFEESKFIYVSSDLAYKPSNTLLKENALLNWTSLNTFVTNRLIAEMYIATTCKNLKVPWTIVRPSVIVGKRDYVHPMADPLTFIIFNLVGEQPLLVKHAQQKRDYLLVEQACVMLANLLQAKESKGIYNLSSARGMTNAELIQRLNAIIRPTVLPKVIESKEGDLVLDNSKIMALGQARGQVEIADFVDELSGIVEHRKALMGE